MLSLSPTLTLLCSSVDTSPSGFPTAPYTLLSVNWRDSPWSARLRLYWRGCRVPSGSGTCTVMYWPGKRWLHQVVVDALDDKRHHIVGLLNLLLDLPLPPYRLRSHAARAVEATLHVDQGVGHQPVHLIPRCRDVRRHRVT